MADKQPQARIGVQFHPQHTTYASFAEAVRRAEAMGADSIWTWDHFFPLWGSGNGNHFEGWTLLTAMATLTTRAELGLMVSSNSYRNPNLLADMARTVDHISNGRVILGIGAGWFEQDYREYGYDFGTAPRRLAALREALPVIKSRLERLTPPPVRNPLPILIGGGGEKVTLRLVARYANLWNGIVSPDALRRKNALIDRDCGEIGRDPAEIERTVLINEGQLGELDSLWEAGGTHLILGLGEPWNFVSVERLVRWREAH